MGLLEIYTDGSDKGRWGSWSFLVLRDGRIVSEASGRERQTDSNRMEFQAAINALEFLPMIAGPGRHEVTLHTDCKILIENIEKFPAWEAANWLRDSGLPVANADLFRKLHALNQSHDIQWNWVRAHAGHPMNERCDELCRIARGA